LIEPELMMQKIVGMLGLDMVLREFGLGKVLQVRGYDRVGGAADSSGQDMPISRVWECQGVD
jgi:hypothetical protein